MVLVTEWFLAKPQQGQLGYKCTSEMGMLEDEEWQSLLLAWNFYRASRVRLNSYWKSAKGTQV